MSHNIFGSRFTSARKPAWHSLGTVFNDTPTVEEAMKRAGATFAYAKLPLRYTVPETVPGGAILPQHVALDSHMVVAREPVTDDPQWRPLTVVSKDYTVLQNTDIAGYMEPVAKKWPVETVGVLGYGERIFVTLDAGLQSVKNDPVHSYFLVTDRKDARGALNIAFTPIRVVCQNTLTLGLSRASMSTALKHTSDLRARAGWGFELIHQLQDRANEAFTVLEEMASRAITDAQARALINDIYPMPALPQIVAMAGAARMAGGVHIDPGVLLPNTDRLGGALHTFEVQKERITALRGASYERYLAFNDEQPSLARTPWALYNAITETEDWREGRGNINESVVFGVRAQVKRRAFEVAAGVLA